MAEEQAAAASDLIALASEITAAWLASPNVRATAEEVPTFLRSMHATLVDLSTPAAAPEVDPPLEYAPAVPVRSSVKPDYIVSLIDGKKLKTLKRHLSTHGLTPAEYRERYGLKADYPMVAPNYAAQRRETAKRIGLGRKARTADPVATPAPAPKRARAKKPEA